MSGNFAKVLRKYPELYPEEYDRLQEKGRFGRTADEQVRYLKLRDEIRAAQKRRRFEVAVAEAVAAQVAPDLPGPVEPEPRGVVPPAAPDAGAGGVVEPPQESPAPASGGADEPPAAAAGEERAPIPPPAAPFDPQAAELRRAKWFQAAVAADRRWTELAAKEGVTQWAPTWLRYGYLALVIECLDEHGLLEPIELGKWEKTAVAVVGAPVVYGPSAYEVYKRRADKARKAAAWNAKRGESESEPDRSNGSSGAPPRSEIESNDSDRISPDSPDEPSEFTWPSPAGTDGSGPSSSPA